MKNNTQSEAERQKTEIEAATEIEPATEMQKMKPEVETWWFGVWFLYAVGNEWFIGSTFSSGSSLTLLYFCT